MKPYAWSGLFTDNPAMPGDEPGIIEEPDELELPAPIAIEVPVVAAPEVATGMSPKRSLSDPVWRVNAGPLGSIKEEYNGRVTAPSGAITVWRQRGEKKPKRFYDLGVVISAYHHIAGNPYPTNKQETLIEFISPDGQWIQSKVRKFVVVERSIGHCLLLPIFTYANQGLATRMGLAPEYIGIFDSVSATPYRSDSSNGFVLATRAPNHADVEVGSFHYLSLSAYAHLTAPVKHEYSTTVTHESTVEGENLTKLLAAYKAAQVDKPPGVGEGPWRPRTGRR